MKFSKVDFDSFKHDMIEYIYGWDKYNKLNGDDRWYEGYEYRDTIDEEIKKAYNRICIPEKNGSVYDFITPINLNIHSYGEPGSYMNPKKIFSIPLGIKAELDSDKVLILFPAQSTVYQPYMIANSLCIIGPNYIKHSCGGDIVVALRDIHTHTVIQYDEETGLNKSIIDNVAFGANSVEFKTGNVIVQGIVIATYSMEGNDKMGELI